MKKYWEQLNSSERRLVAAIGLVVFIVMNVVFIVPKFHGFHRATVRMEQAEKTLAMFKAEVARKPVYDKIIREMLADAQDVPDSDQGINLQRGYQDRALENGVMIQQNGVSVTHTNNQFFVEQEVGARFQATETNLVNFLYSLSADNSLMRVKSMSLRPDVPHQQLIAQMSIVASFQKKAAPRSTAPVKAAAVSTPPANTGAKPAVAAPANKPATNKIVNLPVKAGATTNKPPTLGARPAATNKPASGLPKKP